MTDAEGLLWKLIRNRRIAGMKFRRQHPIGRYILDFYCDEKRLCIELDGGQHGDAIVYDKRRDAWLRSRGIRILRFWNNEMLTETEAVLEAIYRALIEAVPASALTPSPRFAPHDSAGKPSRLRQREPAVHATLPLPRLRERGA